MPTIVLCSGLGWSSAGGVTSSPGDPLGTGSLRGRCGTRTASARRLGCPSSLISAALLNLFASIWVALASSNANPVPVMAAVSRQRIQQAVDWACGWYTRLTSNLGGRFLALTRFPDRFSALAFPAIDRIPLGDNPAARFDIAYANRDVLTRVMVFVKWLLVLPLHNVLSILSLLLITDTHTHPFAFNELFPGDGSNHPK